MRSISPLLITLLLFVLFFLYSLSIVTPGWAGEPGVYTEAASIMAFADTLSHHGYPYRTIMEYERFIYFHPAHPDTPKARFNIACTMKSTGNYAPALELFTSLAKEYGDGTPGIEALFQKAEIFYLTHDYTSALTHYTEFLTHYPQHQLAEKARKAIEKIEKQRDK